MSCNPLLICWEEEEVSLFSCVSWTFPNLLYDSLPCHSVNQSSTDKLTIRTAFISLSFHVSVRPSTHARMHDIRVGQVLSDCTYCTA